MISYPIASYSASAVFDGPSITQAWQAIGPIPAIASTGSGALLLNGLFAVVSGNKFKGFNRNMALRIEFGNSTGTSLGINTLGYCYAVDSNHVFAAAYMMGPFWPSQAIHYYRFSLSNSDGSGDASSTAGSLLYFPPALAEYYTDTGNTIPRMATLAPSSSVASIRYAINHTSSSAPGKFSAKPNGSTLYKFT